MKRRTGPNLSANPFLVWTDLAFKTSEMLLASAQVIGHRTSRMALAGPSPSARDRKEFTLMAQEKVEAVAESTQAMTFRMLSVNQQISIMAFKQMLSGASGFAALAGSRTMLQSGRRQAEFAGETMARSAAIAAHLSGSMAHLASHGLKPIHSRATGNAKRLLKG